MLTFLNANKTKLIGALLAVLSFAQANPALGELLSEKQYAWTMFIVGCIVIFFGFLNNPENPAPPSSKQGGFARSWMLAILLAISSAVAIAPLYGCVAAKPVQEAESLEQRAYALYGTYVVFNEKAAELVQDSATPDKVKQALRAADKVAYPVAESLVDAALEVEKIRELVSQGVTPEERLALALANLSTIYFSAQPKLLAVVSAVKEAK